MMNVDQMMRLEFGSFSDLLAARAQEHGDKVAIIHDDRAVTYTELDRRLDQIAAALQRDGLAKGDVVAICGQTSLVFLEVFLGAIRAGCVAAPLALSAIPESILAQTADCGAKMLFLDSSAADHLAPVINRFSVARVRLDASGGDSALNSWLGTADLRAAWVPVEPTDPFNIIYSSGTTGTPKGIVQPHRMRWSQIFRTTYPFDAITLLSTPLYSNTTLVSLIPTLGMGGTIILMSKFDVVSFLELAQKHQVTHAMLVPVQYSRLLSHPAFDRYDLSSFVMKFATSAPFPAELKRDILARWPGGLTEFYGMTEGGATCALRAHEHPDKLHTVGKPFPGHEVRLIDAGGLAVEAGGTGEIVGRSPAMMIGYHNQPAKTAEAEWRSPDGDRFMRTGDVGRFDADGFLILQGRIKDMIISGGFNIYPIDLEKELEAEPGILEAAVVGVPSKEWGESPVGFVVLRPGVSVAAEELRSAVNGRLGKTQRLAEVRIVEVLPRSPIGKVMKAELRDTYARGVDLAD